ncbi:MAG: trehalose utilization protein ThuA [Isosphaeraceae bacterium]|jgi:trehalose utilization protein|nr:MAG: trehalose utilization protein ThuA [Isosphaeraceae bacterium]
MPSHLGPRPADRLLNRRSWLRAAACTSLTGHQALSSTLRSIGVANPIRLRIWCEGTAPPSVYPDDVDGAIAQAFRSLPEFQITTARLREPDSGLGDTQLDATDVLIWWGRLCHEDVPDDRARAIADRVRAGRLGLIALHTSFASKPFRLAMGQDCEPETWGEAAGSEQIDVVAPDHPITQGVASFVLPYGSRFAEPFAVPEPETVLLVSRYQTGESFRSGLTWSVGTGRVVYLRPGDDTHPVLFHPSVRNLISNAARWCAPRSS